MVQVGHVEGEIVFRAKLNQDVQKAKGIGSARDPDDQRVACAKQIVALDSACSLSQHIGCVHAYRLMGHCSQWPSFRWSRI